MAVAFMTSVETGYLVRISWVGIVVESKFQLASNPVTTFTTTFTTITPVCLKKQTVV